MLVFVQKLVQANNSICGKGNHDVCWSKYFRFNDHIDCVTVHNILKTVVFGAIPYSDVTMNGNAYQITGIPSVPLTICSGVSLNEYVWIAITISLKFVP